MGRFENVLVPLRTPFVYDHCTYSQSGVPAGATATHACGSVLAEVNETATELPFTQGSSMQSASTAAGRLAADSAAPTDSCASSAPTGAAQPTNARPSNPRPD